MGRNTALPEGFERFRVTATRRPDDTGCGVLHVDMDAFFAAVELRTRPELAEQPVVVAGAGPRSVVVSANYPARRYGIHSAMPAATARRLCPQAVFLPPTRGLYSEVSRGVMALFADVTPVVEPLGLDEAFLDVSGALRRLGSGPAEIATRLRALVADEFGITCSVGVAGVKFVAKLASGMAKPDGTVVVPVPETREFLRPLPVGALWGVGPRTERALRSNGLDTVADLAATPAPRLRRLLGTAAGDHLHALAHGRDERPVVPDAEEKSVGAERTFDSDLRGYETLERELLRLSGRVGRTLRSRGLRGRTVSLKVRFTDFRTVTRARTLSCGTDVARRIHRTAVDLLADTVPGDAAVRLLGVRVEGLTGTDEPEQLSLEDALSAEAASTGSGREPERRWREAEAAADVARSRFGNAAVRPASLLPPDGV